MKKLNTISNNNNFKINNGQQYIVQNSNSTTRIIPKENIGNVVIDFSKPFIYNSTNTPIDVYTGGEYITTISPYSSFVLSNGVTYTVNNKTIGPLTGYNIVVI